MLLVACWNRLDIPVGGPGTFTIVFSPPPPPTVPGDLAAEMDLWVDLAHGMWWAWVAVGHQGAISPGPGSPAAGEDAVLAHTQPAWGPGNAIDAGVQAAQLVDAAAQHLLGIAALYQARQVVLPTWPVVRAELEHLARATWILSPEITPEQRVARCWLERLFGVYQYKLTLSGLRVPAGQVKEARRTRENIRAEIERRFPGSLTEPPEVGQHPDWAVGGERLATLGETMRHFTGAHLDVQRLYDALSYLSHPAVFELASIARPVESNGHLAFPYQANPMRIARLISLATVALYRAAWVYCSFFDYDGAVLERWADVAAVAAPDLFKPTTPS